MIFEYQTLKLIWLLLIGGLWIGFLVTGGIDLGICALLPWVGKNDKERRLILASIGPTWEGNQVWLITAIGAMFAAWPFLYAALFSTLYVVFLLLLIPLILKPPSLDFRSKLASLKWRSTWDYCLSFSGSVPAFLFGVIFANLLSGISFQYDINLMPHTKTDFFSLLNPYTLSFGIVSLSIILLQASLFLQLKTVNHLHKRIIKMAIFFGILFIISFAMVWIWTVFKIEGFHIIAMPDPNKSFTPLSKEVTKGIGIWLNNYQQYPIGYLAPVLSIMGVILALIASFLQAPLIGLFFNSISLISLVITVGFTLFPFILPSISIPNHSLTIWDAASSKLTLTWMLGAACIFLPLILSYTAWVFKIMHGKITDSEMY